MRSFRSSGHFTHLGRFFSGIVSVWAISLVGFSSTAGAEESPVISLEPQFATREFQDCESCPPMVEVIDPVFGPQDIAIARHELTWAEYLPSVFEADCPLPELAHDKRYPQDLSKLADDLPLTYLPPAQIDCFLVWLNDKTDQVYRLPSGEEWEFFARAGAITRYPWGDDPGTNMAAIYEWYDSAKFPRRPDRLHDPRNRGGDEYFPVEQFPPNRFGLFDVIGNLPEYTNEQPPTLQSCIERRDFERCRRIVVRGGGYFVTLWGAPDEVLTDKPDLLDVGKVRLFFLPQPIGYRVVRELVDE